jgi:hypothetical protein
MVATVQLSKWWLQLYQKELLAVAYLLAATLYQGNPDKNHYLWVNTTGATSGAGTAHPSGVPEFTSGF